MIDGRIVPLGSALALAFTRKHSLGRLDLDSAGAYATLACGRRRQEVSLAAMRSFRRTIRGASMCPGAVTRRGRSDLRITAPRHQKGASDRAAANRLSDPSRGQLFERCDNCVVTPGRTRHVDNEENAERATRLRNALIAHLAERTVLGVSSS